MLDDLFDVFVDDVFDDLLMFVFLGDSPTNEPFWEPSHGIHQLHRVAS